MDNKTKKIYIWISASGTGFSKFLRFFTRQKYNHVSLSMEKDLNVSYSFGRKNLYLPFIAGFTEEYPDKGVFAKYDVKLQVFELEVPVDKLEKLNEYLEDYTSHKSLYRYNFLGLPFIFFNRPFERKHKFLCSQFVAKILMDSDIHDFCRSYSLIRPTDFYELPMTMIYEGRLRDYTEVAAA